MAAQVTEQVAARARPPAVYAGVPLLTAKITAPGVPDWALPRPRVTTLITQGKRWCPLTIANGPAGAGKTMALALWAAAGPGTVAWIGLDGQRARAHTARPRLDRTAAAPAPEPSSGAACSACSDQPPRRRFQAPRLVRLGQRTPSGCGRITRPRT
jgi:hypothetical protein